MECILIKDNIYIIIDPIIRAENMFKGFLRSIPLIQTYFNVNNFTFIYSQKKSFPPFIYDFTPLHKNKDYTQLNGSICQINNQELEIKSKEDTTYLLYMHFINGNTQLNSLYFIFDSPSYELKPENNLEEKSFIEDKGLISIMEYKNLLKKQFRKEKINSLPLNIDKKSGNYIIQKMASRYLEDYGKNIIYLADLFNFKKGKVSSDSPAWEMLEYFARTTTPMTYEDDVYKHLRLFIETDITKICQYFYYALKKVEFNNNRVKKWRYS